MSQPALRLHVPEPSGRPGCTTDFSYLHLSPAGVAGAAETGAAIRVLGWPIGRVLSVTSAPLTTLP